MVSPSSKSPHWPVIRRIKPYQLRGLVVVEYETVVSFLELKLLSSYHVKLVMSVGGSIGYVENCF